MTEQYSLDAETHAISTSKGYKKLVEVMDLAFRAKPSLRLKSERFVKDVWVRQSLVRSHRNRNLRKSDGISSQY